MTSGQPVGALLLPQGGIKARSIDGYYFHILTSPGTNARGEAKGSQTSNERMTDRVAFAPIPWRTARRA